jgi:hypothetical protein
VCGYDSLPGKVYLHVWGGAVGGCLDVRLFGILPTIDIGVGLVPFGRCHDSEELAGWLA